MDYNLSEYHKQLSQMSQSQAKIFINSYYPITGNMNFLMYDPSVAESVTKLGSGIVMSVIAND